MENEKRDKIEMLEKRTNRLESIYVVYNNLTSAGNKSHWKAEWYRELYGIKEKE